MDIDKIQFIDQIWSTVSDSNLAYRGLANLPQSEPVMAFIPPLLKMKTKIAPSEWISIHF